MSKEQKASAGAENSSKIPLNEESDESGEAVREKFMKAISGNPRFIPAKPAGKAFVIGGMRPFAKH